MAKDQDARIAAENAQKTATRAEATAKTVNDALREPTTGVFARLDDLECQAKALGEGPKLTGESLIAVLGDLPNGVEPETAIQILNMVARALNIPITVGKDLDNKAGSYQIIIEEQEAAIGEQERAIDLAQLGAHNAEQSAESNIKQATEAKERATGDLGGTKGFQKIIESALRPEEETDEPSGEPESSEEHAEAPDSSPMIAEPAS